MALAYSNKINNAALGTGTSVATASVSFVTGRLYIVSILTATTVNVTALSGGGITWVRPLASTAFDGTSTLTVFYGVAVSTTNSTITVTSSATSAKLIIVDEIDGVDAALFDEEKNTTNTGTNNSITMTTFPAEYTSRAISTTAAMTQDVGWTVGRSTTASSKRVETSYNFAGASTTNATTAGSVNSIVWAMSIVPSPDTGQFTVIFIGD